jgi:hypothetical protein
VEHSQSWADLEYGRILPLTATLLESAGESALSTLRRGVPPYETWRLPRASGVPTCRSHCLSSRGTTPS